MNTTGKFLVVASCLVILGSVFDSLVRDPPREKARVKKELPDFMKEFRERRQLDDPNDMGPRPRRHIWRNLFEKATDYSRLVQLVRPSAERGNGEAQFALYRAFSYCSDGLRERDDAERLPDIMLRDVHAHCDALVAQYPDPAEEATVWLARSLESKHPHALAFVALEDIRDMNRKAPTKSERTRRLQAARADLLLALKANDPEVTLLVPEFLPALFSGDARTERAAWVWRLAACEQELECGAAARFIRDDCIAHDRCVPGESGEHYIRRVSGDFASLMARARNLARMLRKSELDGQKFDETVTSLPEANAVPAKKPPRILEQ